MGANPTAAPYTRGHARPTAKKRALSNRPCHFAGNIEFVSGGRAGMKFAAKALLQTPSESADSEPLAEIFLVLQNIHPSPPYQAN